MATPRTVPAALLTALLACLAVGGCGTSDRSGLPPGLAASLSALPPQSDDPGATGQPSGSAGLPVAASAFTAHFTDPIYQDESDEFAPFGSDEGSDLVHEWAGRRSELTDRSTVAQILQGSDFTWVERQLGVPEPPGVPTPAGQVDAAIISIGAGFTLLRLTGHIDPAGKALTLKAIGVLVARYDSPPQLLRLRADLQSWQES